LNNELPTAAGRGRGGTILDCVSELVTDADKEREAVLDGAAPELARGAGKGSEERISLDSSRMDVVATVGGTVDEPLDGILPEAAAVNVTEDEMVLLPSATTRCFSAASYSVRVGIGEESDSESS
jgi:hypothetical protein